MTPEFRAGLYRFNTTKDKAAIPFELQRLFAKLHRKEKQAISTRALTKSFGWDRSDSFTQHDVQELCRVLFDALEDALKVISKLQKVQTCRALKTVT
jgi:ubiquitin carboxyl-terminal hydrolase 7